MSLSSKNNPMGVPNNELLLSFPMARKFLKNTYDIGLQSLSFFPAPPPKRRIRRIQPSTPISSFPNAVWTARQLIKIKKESPSLTSFFSTFSKAVEPHGIKAIVDTIAPQILGSSPDIFVRLECTIDDANTYVELPLKLANQFKLPVRQIRKGLVHASDISSQLEFNDIPMGTEFTILIITDSTTEDRIVCEEQVECMLHFHCPINVKLRRFFYQNISEFSRCGLQC